MSTRYQTVIIVEENSATREMYQRELEPCFTVYSCATVSKALEILTREKVDVMIFEPEGLGTNVWNLLQKTKSNPKKIIPVILCSTLEVYDESRRKDLAACLVKPVLPSTLLHVVRNVLQSTNKPEHSLQEVNK